MHASMHKHTNLSTRLTVASAPFSICYLHQWRYRCDLVLQACEPQIQHHIPPVIAYLSSHREKAADSTQSWQSARYTTRIYTVSRNAKCMHTHTHTFLPTRLDDCSLASSISILVCSQIEANSCNVAVQSRHNFRDQHGAISPCRASERLSFSSLRAIYYTQCFVL